MEAANWAMERSEAARKRERQIANLSRGLAEIEGLKTEEKVPRISSLFLYAADCSNLLAMYPKLRNIVLAKVEEFSKDERAASIREDLLKVKEAITALSGREDYVA